MLACFIAAFCTTVQESPSSTGRSEDNNVEHGSAVGKKILNIQSKIFNPYEFS
jgi:hypothetical protein